MKKYMTSLELGALVRRSYMQALCDYCVKKGYELHFSECRGWISSIFYVVIDMPEEEIPSLRKFIRSIGVEQ